jgi:hypothetical protein
MTRDLIETVREPAPRALSGLHPFQSFPNGDVNRFGERFPGQRRKLARQSMVSAFSMFSGTISSM